MSRAATAMRGALKEPTKRKALQNDVFHYNASAWEAGKQGAKSPVETLAAAGK